MSDQELLEIAKETVRRQGYKLDFGNVGTVYQMLKRVRSIYEKQAAK